MSITSSADTNHLDPAIVAHVDALCAAARPAARALAVMEDTQRRQALEAAACAIEADREAILAANAADVADGRANTLSTALLDRLDLTGGRLDTVIANLRSVKDQPDPVGHVLEERTIAGGITLQKMSVPIGVVAIIFESRPNVTVDTAALCLRSGNACILRGGKEAARTNTALADAFRRGIQEAGVDGDAVQLVARPERDLVPELLSREGDIDLVVPRGGEGLIRAVVACSKVPVVKHDKGVCNCYLHASADAAMAVAVALNAKTQRPGVCNAIENILVDADAAERLLPVVGSALREAGVEIRADERAQSHIPGAVPASTDDWKTEYLDLIVAVKVVADVAEAVTFINEHGSHHSDTIIAEDASAADVFLRGVDSACVYHNASTRFTDGAQFGLGAEVGISTNRLHARGPMGAGELCTYKYVLRGNGQTL